MDRIKAVNFTSVQSNQVATFLNGQMEPYKIHHLVEDRGQEEEEEAQQHLAATFKMLVISEMMAAIKVKVSNLHIGNC